MIDIFLNYGPNLTYLGIVVFLVLTGAGLPLPEELAIVAAGVLSSGDEPFLNVYVAFAACLIGALLGDLLGTKASARLTSAGNNNDILIEAAVNGSQFNGATIQIVLMPCLAQASK